MNLVWKLLKENISKAQLAGFFIANLIGLTIVFVACQFYFDIHPIFSGEDELFKKDYFTLTKKVSLVNTFSSSASNFSNREIEELKNSSFTKDLGIFTSSQFNVFAGISQGGTGFNTEMFFESVPDRFIDVKPTDWNFTPSSNIIPIIVPKNYLDLYNFGYAEARSLPKISEGMVNLITLDVTIFGNNQSKRMKGRIVGFSNRINTILVPETFMNWANQQYGNTSQHDPSRIIVEISNIADPTISEFLNEKGYQVEGENTAVSKMSYFLKLLVTIVIAVGGIICLLSIMILALSIYLLLEKNMQKLHKLRLIGYSKATVTRPYHLLVLGINTVILILSLLVVAIIKSRYWEEIQKVWSNAESTSMIKTILIGTGIFLFLSLINILIINKKVK